MAHGRSKKAEAQKEGPERAPGRPTREGEGPGGGKGARRAGAQGPVGPIGPSMWLIIAVVIVLSVEISGMSWSWAFVIVTVPALTCIPASILILLVNRLIPPTV